jgi:heme oxygenase
VELGADRPEILGSGVRLLRTPFARNSSVVQRLSRTLIQLNIATRPHHVDADQPWIDLMSQRVERSQYLAQLIKVYGFEAPLDSAFRYTPGLASLIDLRGRTRTGLLAHDLMRLGVTASQIAQLPQRFLTFGSAAEALGWMYVVERASLVHGNVRRHLALRLPELACATSYLDAYDGVTSLRWSELGAAFDAIAHVPAVTRQIIRAASEGLRAMCDWFQGTERAPRLKQSVAT